MLLEVFVIEQQTSILLSRWSALKKQFQMDGQLFSGLMSAISCFIENLEIGSVKFLETGQNRIQLYPHESFVVVGIVESSKEAQFVENAIRRIAETFWERFQDDLKDWDNDVRTFRKFQDTVGEIMYDEFTKFYITRKYPHQLIKTVREFQDKFEAKATRNIGEKTGISRAEKNKRKKDIRKALHKELDAFSVNEVEELPETGFRAELSVCPICRGIHDDAFSCLFIEGFLEGFMNSVVGQKEQYQVEEVSCQAHGDPACIFEVNKTSRD